MGLPDAPAGMRIMAIADINNDKLNDLITVDSSAQTVTVYYYDDSNWKYTSTSNFDVEAGWKIDSIIPTSITSGLQNLIVVASKGANSTKLLYYKQKQNGSSSATANHYSWDLDDKNELTGLELAAGSQPMTLDVNGDQSMDLLY